MTFLMNSRQELNVELCNHQSKIKAKMWDGTLIIKKATHNAVRRSGATNPAGKSELPIRLMLFLKILLILKRNSIFLRYRCVFLCLAWRVRCTLFIFLLIALFHYIFWDLLHNPSIYKFHLSLSSLGHRVFRNLINEMGNFWVLFASKEIWKSRGPENCFKKVF